MRPRKDTGLSIVCTGFDSLYLRSHFAIGSPRLWVSTNPWKVASSFKAVSSTKEEYLVAIEHLKKDAPPEKQGGKKGRFENAHANLIATLERRLEDIDAEFAVSIYLVSVDFCIKCRLSAEVGTCPEKDRAKKFTSSPGGSARPRTRRQAQRPGYVYHDGISEVFASLLAICVI